MSFESLFGSLNISASGLTAERLRMETVANNIANAFSTRTPEGGPYRRKDVIFATALAQAVRRKGTGGNEYQEVLGGVQVEEVVDDPKTGPVVYRPGHPDANAEGYLQLPNVELPLELVNLTTAARAYEANVRAGQVFQQITQQALAILQR